MHTFGVKGKDGFRGIAQLRLVGEILHASLVMMNKDYWAIRIQISTETRDKLRTGLKTHGILKGAWNLASLDTEVSMSIKKDFVDSLVRIMSDDECKANVDSLLCDGIYPFTYDVKTTEPGQFPDPGMFHVDNFQVCTSVAVEMRLQSWNFKPKGANEVTRGYSSKPVGLYRIEDIKMAQPLTPEKRQKQDDDWISTPPRTRATNSALNLLQWLVTKDEKSKLPGSSNIPCKLYIELARPSLLCIN